MTVDKAIEIIIELEGDDIARIPDFQDILESNETYKRLDKTGIRARNYVHFLKRKYALGISEIECLADFVLEKIEIDFEPVMTKMILLLDQKQ